MAIIISMYTSILALAVWQENHGRDETGNADKGC
jgi:hypothetical protein